MNITGASLGKLASLMRGVTLPVLIAVVAISCDQARNAGPGQRNDANIQSITTAEQFEAVVLQADKPVVVDFFATWCGPCRRLAPVLDDLAAQYKGRAVFVRIDVDQSRPLALKYRVSSIPDVRIFSHGRAVAKIIGSQEAEKYRTALNAAIAADSRKDTKK